MVVLLQSFSGKTDRIAIKTAQIAFDLSATETASRNQSRSQA
jgi:hypothetical protein